MMGGFPFLTILFLAMRSGITERTLSNMADKHLAFCKYIDQTCANFGLITSYAKQDRIEAEFESHVKARNTKATIQGTVALNNRYFAKWLAALVAAGYTVIGGLAVIRG